MNFSKVLIAIQTFSFKTENAFENAACKKASISSRSQYDNSASTRTHFPEMFLSAN